MSREDLQLLALVRSGMWGHSIDDDVPMDDCDWERLYQAAKTQTIIGVCASAFDFWKTQKKPPKLTLAKWMANTSKIEETNRKHRRVIGLVNEHLKKNNIEALFMKGVVCGVRYPNPYRRQCGDIDFIVGRSAYNKTLQSLSSIGRVDLNLVHEHHGMAWVDGVTLEPHYKVHNYQYPSNDIAMERIYNERALDGYKTIDIDGSIIQVMPATLESVFLVSHMVNHVYEEGLGLRQVIDFAIFLNSCKNEIKEELHSKWLDMMHMKEAHRIFTRICEEYLGLSPDIMNYNYTESEKKFARKMMNDIMNVGNFGRGKYVFDHSSKLGKMRNYMWVTRRALNLYQLCPTEALSWPISKFLRFFRKQTKNGGDMM